MLGIDNIQWLGHASFKIRNSRIIYIDPWHLTVTAAADIILITHQHYDHCSPRDIKMIQSQKTIIVAPADCRDKLSGNIKSIAPGENLDCAGVRIEAVPAYNIGKSFHPRRNNWVGYIITLDDTRIYHAGDTDLVPEIENLKADIVLLPIGGTYTMDVSQAAALANKIRPKIAVPMHYGTVVGSEADAEEFKRLCAVAVQILPQL